MLAFIPEAMECVEPRSGEHTRLRRAKWMLAFTSEPMVCVERQTGVVLRPIALPRNLIVAAPAARPIRGPEHRSARGLSHVGWYATHEPTERLSPANGDTQFS